MQHWSSISDVSTQDHNHRVSVAWQRSKTLSHEYNRSRRSSSGPPTAHPNKEHASLTA
jgi:hypothetical protein